MADYIGKDKVIGVAKVEDFTTPLGGEVVKVVFQNAHPKLMTKKTFDILVSAKESDDTSIQKKKFSAMIPELIGVILEYDIQWYEIEAVIRSIKETLEMRYDRAASYLWRDKDDSYFVAGNTPSNFWSALEAEQILKHASQHGEGKGNNDKGAGRAAS